jgi:hypothetical protein
MKKPLSNFARQTGISYIEVLIAVLLIAVSLIPMMDAMRGAAESSGSHEDAAVRHAHLLAKMEIVLAEPYSSLENAAIAAGMGGDSWYAPSTYSDPSGAGSRRLVFLSLYDGDNADSDANPFTGVDGDLMWVRTEIEGTPVAVETLVYR